MIMSEIFFCATLTEFFARTEPASINKNPACIRKTRNAAMIIQPSDIESTSPQRLVSPNMENKTLTRVYVRAEFAVIKYILKTLRSFPALKKRVRRNIGAVEINSTSVRMPSFSSLHRCGNPVGKGTILLQPFCKTGGLTKG